MVFFHCEVIMTVISFLLTAILGAGQFLLLAGLLGRALAGDFTKTAVYLMAKLMLYGAAAAVMVLLLKPYLIPAAAGYASGVPVAAIAYFALRAAKGKKLPSTDSKGDDALDGNTDN